MSELVRLSLSLEQDLFAQLETAVADMPNGNRSEFIRSLLRNHLAAHDWHQQSTVVATISFTFDHHAPHINDRLVALQHDSAAEVMVSTHLHISHHLCLELLVVRGTPKDIAHLEAGLRQLRGIHHVSLSPAILGQDDAPHHHPQE
ncbi:MAG: nickel-responsive transcriptional regulator NikR [Planctomycetota bacterium]|nr:MAG: nickel-responsive transcriptional regulator NikR [Planctomycetota bacterium]